MKNALKYLLPIGIIGFIFYMLNKKKTENSDIKNNNNDIVDEIENPKQSYGTLGQKNNNPGNIRYNSANNWIEQVGENKGFVVFDTMNNGLRAMCKLLLNYYSLNKLNTISKILNKYAPNSENPTSNYINYVSNATGIKSDETLSQDQLPVIINAMCVFESGIKFKQNSINEIFYQLT